MASYKILIKKTAAKELEAIAGKKDRERITQRILALADDPRPAGVEKLSGTTEKYRIRQGNFRILYTSFELPTARKPTGEAVADPG